MTNQVVPREAFLDGLPSGPPNLITLTWRDLIKSSWKDTNYKRTAIASLIQAVYLLELDRQENRTQENALAPSWWKPFKYKLTQTLIDERDGSIFGAIFEWDRSAALADMLPIRPRGAPKAVLALRGTLLRSPTRRRDIEDDIRFATWENLNGSVRFQVTLEALKSISETYGRRNVYIVGHSLGAGFGLQVRKELAKEGINVEAHLFNPPSVSLAMSIGNIGEKAEYVWNGLKFMFSSACEAELSNGEDNLEKIDSIGLKSLIFRLSNLMDARLGVGNRVPHLYVNSNDYISCFYSYTDGREEITDKEKMSPSNGQNVAKLFVVSKENQEFREAHSLKQWWSSHGEFQQDVHDGKLIISRELGSLNIATPSLVIPLLYPHIVSFAMSHINIRVTTDFLWNVLKSVSLYSGDNTSVASLKDWIPQLPGLKDASYWVGKCIPYVYKNGGTGEMMTDKENIGPTSEQIIVNLFLVSKEKQKFLAAHGLEQWWPSDAELRQVIQNRKRISGKLRYLYTGTPWEVTHLLNPSSVSLAMSLSNIGEREEFVWKWNSLKASMLPSSWETQVSTSNDRDKTVGKWVPQLSGLKDAGFAVGKWVPQLCSYNSDYLRQQLRSLHSATPSQVSHLFNLPSVLPAMSLRNTGEVVWNRLKSMCPSSCEAQVSNDKASEAGLKSWMPQISGLKDACSGVGKWVSQLYGDKGNGTAEKMFNKENTGPSQLSQEKQSG
ncbi:hypothetical protein RJT34_10995 [Clitoria ternatea]|uniref:Triacylglycerol lipase n=1 Tax=Clitoria ternatea TaxID=43366 RepID=A0AAN9JMP8_CLITE